MDDKDFNRLADEMLGVAEEREGQLFQWRMVVKHEQLLEGKPQSSAEVLGGKLKNCNCAKPLRLTYSTSTLCKPLGSETML